MRLDPAEPGDFRKGRQNTVIDTVVIHTTEGGSITGACAWWDREDVTASAHYLIDGKEIVQRVAEGDTAFHAGNSLFNRRSIGIEVVGHADRIETWTMEKLHQLAALTTEIVLRHSIPVLHQAGPGICGHADVPHPRFPSLKGGANGHHDPGKHFPWLPFLALVRASVESRRLDVPERVG